MGIRVLPGFLTVNLDADADADAGIAEELRPQIVQSSTVEFLGLPFWQSKIGISQIGSLRLPGLIRKSTGSLALIIDHGCVTSINFTCIPGFSRVICLY